jgi:hypothetical protein
MGVLPNAIKTDPWELTQKFIDQQARESSEDKRYANQMEIARMRLAAKGANLSPYEKARQQEQAKIDAAQSAAGQGIQVRGRYRIGGSGEGQKGDNMPGDPGVRKEFLDATGVTNPFGLAVLAGTGQHESGWSAKRVNHQWEDRSEGGEWGMSGGLFSWRDDAKGGKRLSNMKEYAAGKGEEWGKITPRTQGEFYARENPQLIARLNNAGSLEEAQKIINENIKFAGYNRPGGQAASRYQTSARFLKVYGNPMTAKQTEAGGREFAATPAGVSTEALFEPDGREFTYQRMNTQDAKNRQSTMTGGRRMIVLDLTAGPTGVKNEATYKVYTGGTRDKPLYGQRSGAPATAQAPTTPTTPTTPAAPAVTAGPPGAAGPRARGAPVPVASPAVATPPPAPVSIPAPPAAPALPPPTTVQPAPAISGIVTPAAAGTLPPGGQTPSKHAPAFTGRNEDDDEDEEDEYEDDDEVEEY